MTEPVSRALPARARIVVIGGGVGGSSVAYHLALAGERDVVVLDRHELTSGSTFHSAGLVGQLRSDPTLTAMNRYSVELYRSLQAGDNPPGWVECGSIRLASSKERWEEISRQAGWAATSGLELQQISASEAQELFPLMVTDGVVGAAYLPTDGQVDPSQLTYSLAAGARAMGVQFHTHTRVLGIDTEGAGLRRRVTRVRTDKGDVECELVVDCGGMFAAEIARMVGVRVPIVPMSHQYVVTEAMFEHRETPLPSLRDPDLLVYYRQEVDGLVMGGYERQSLPWTASASSYDRIPADFNGRLLSPDHDRFVEISENAVVRVPSIADVGIRSFINGPEAFTPDNEFCLGPTDVGGFFVAAGFCAHGIAGAGGIGKVMAEWVLEGAPPMDLWHMDVRRFGQSYRSPSYTLARTVENYESYYDIRYPAHERTAGRPLRTSPAYSWHAAHGASFGEKSGWERVNHYDPNAVDADEQWRPDGWAGRHWSPAVVAEHRATREGVVMFDETSFAKIEVSGPDAARLLQWVCDNDVARGPGTVTYTQALNASGGIECDFTVTQLDAQVFLIVTGTAFANHDAAWIRTQARHLEADVRITDVTGAWACFGIWGPKTREVLAALTPQSLENDDFPFLAMRETTVGDVPVRMVRVTFVGELGWELYCPAEYGANLWRTVWEAGGSHGIVAGGYRAIDSLRLEKGYRVWGADIDPAHSPYEAGLGFCVRLGKEGGFLGRDALVAQKEAGVTQRLACLVLDGTKAVALGNEPVRLPDGDVLGRITSGGLGYSLGASIAFVYLPVGRDGGTDLTADGTRLQVGIFGEWVGATVRTDPLYDPRSERVRA
ncbi:GcvT family protein [Longivirga aurantiaca]|uniref:FAD-dependent oxidoreductase n=1 Tax=Longivirga aurantiaca TaxID=1837743 RepID=A0ABW1SZQ6_9ACTN